MVKSLSIEEAERTIRQQFGSRSDAADQEAGFVEENGEPIAVLISPKRYRSLSHERFWATVDRMRAKNADKDPDQVLADITELVEEVRRERRAATR